MKIGLALGGGSARGLAHIAVLEAFDELGVRPSQIAGCSIGALVGALYAGGMSAKDIRAHATRLLANRVVFARYVFGSKKSRLRDLFSVRSLTSLRLNGVQLANVAIPEHLPRLLEHQKIPLKIVATDYEAMSEVVLETGSVIEAVGASIAIPGLISGPRIRGHLHVDGGVTNPVPFNHVRADITVAIDVTGRPRPLAKKSPSNIELAIGSLLILFNELADLRRAQDPPDIYITPHVEGFGGADFFKVKEILAAAEPAKDQLKRALEAHLKT